jgi:chromate reductase, NAD(P)H dehydrogenase (quinone)
MTQFKSKFKLGVIVGSNRRDSINKKLAGALAKLGADAFEATVIRIDDLPLYNQDLEAALPEAVVRFKAEIVAADALLVVTPEYNRSIPTVLKNAIDWGTRPWGQNSWTGKLAAVTGTSPGAIGTAIVQQHLRSVLGNIGVLVMGGEAYVTFKPDLLDVDNNVSDETTRNFLKTFIGQLAALAAKHAAKPAGRAAA